MEYRLLISLVFLYLSNLTIQDELKTLSGFKESDLEVAQTTVISAGMNKILNRPKKSLNFNNSGIDDVEVSVKITNINDARKELKVFWLGGNSNVIVCISKDHAKNLPSALYISYNGGSTYQNKTDNIQLPNGSHAKIDNYYTHPKDNSCFSLTDLKNKIIFVTTNNGRSFNKLIVPFTPGVVSFYNYRLDTFLVLDKNLHQLWVTEDSGQNWKLIQNNVKAFFWLQGDNEQLVVQRLELNGSSTIFYSANAAKELKIFDSEIVDFYVKEDYLFFSKNSGNGGYDLYVSYKLGSKIKCIFNTMLDKSGFHVADVTNDRAFVVINHNDILFYLYVSENLKEAHDEVNFSLSLESVFCYFPNGYWSGSWLRYAYTLQEPFADVYKIKGLAGVYIASQVALNNRKLESQHLSSKITFDYGRSWQLIKAPQRDAQNQTINCSQATNCSLHLGQRLNYLDPRSRSPEMFSSEAAPGIIIATGVAGKSFKGKMGVYMSADGGFNWKHIVNGFHSFSIGDHGGIITVVRQTIRRETTRHMLYSTDEGETWQTKQFSLDLKVYKLLTETGEKATVFTIFGSRPQTHNWVFVKLDMAKTFKLNCTRDSYKLWASNCVLDKQIIYERRSPRTNCRYGPNYNRSSFVCTNENCLSNRWRCDDDKSCASNFTEETCPKTTCADDAFMCENEVCIPARFKCDGKRDCVADGSDELNCENTTCPVKYFMCNNRKCIPVVWACDGKNDCGDSSDELNCSNNTNRTCSIDLFLCNNGICIPQAWKCDGQRDCPDGFDENNCSKNTNKTCPIGKFACNSGNCIPQAWKCDGDTDCLDGFDEENCPDKTCSIDQYSCNNGKCISTLLKCNGEKDCLDGSDEINCPNKTCSVDQFSCNNGKCISTLLKCNGEKDCLDGSDEINCPNKTCSVDQFSCNNGKCISTMLKCNGKKDCLDGFDEINCPNKTCSVDQLSCNNGKCISTMLKCNGKKDCLDGSDEINCPNKTCSVDQFSCNNGKCISTILKCNGENDCLDGSDESICPNKICLVDQFRCNKGNCIPQTWKCDGERDCPDGSDEINCPNKTCLVDQFSCNNGNCISERWKCDGERDCPNGSDEINCPNKTCLVDQFSCNNGNCISERWKCDGERDCPNGSDEINCPNKTCSVDQFNCNNGKCISTLLKCNGENDCIDGSDEINCPNKTCSVDQFSCNNGKCISTMLKCNGENDCLDGSDESICPNKTCSVDQFSCNNGNCIPQAWKCNGENDCVDGSDESNCPNRTCRFDQFVCNSGNCIPLRWKCDGSRECPDGSDEINCPNKTCSADQFGCENGVCISILYKCNGEKECSDGSDENNCPNKNCSMGQFLCSNGICIPPTWRCDNVKDCPGGSDEENCPDKTCSANQFTCNNGECIFMLLQCDGVKDCLDGSDESICPNKTCPVGQFVCNNGNCISQTWKCDGARDCPDGSDEKNCPKKTCAVGQFGCGDGNCIHSMWRCDSERDCADGSDEMNCNQTNCTTRQFSCKNGRCIKVELVCDGENDCRDGSDEKNCATVEPATCETNQFRCAEGSTRCIPSKWKCDGDYDCSDKSDEIYCNYNISKFSCGGPTYRNISTSWVCDGEQDCPNGSDEKNCSVTLPSQTTPNPNITKNSSVCSDWMFTCSNRKCIPRWWRCDSVDDCGDNSDEKGCGIHKTTRKPTTIPVEKPTACTYNSFQCGSGKCIPDSFVCNGFKDCNGGEDEMHCKEVPHCALGEFKCRTGDSCIPVENVCDNDQDCPDGSDEATCSISRCPLEHFQCDRNSCQPLAALCDEIKDCQDGFDEKNCSGTKGIYHGLQMGIDKRSADEHSLLLYWWIPIFHQGRFEFLPSLSKIGNYSWMNKTWTEKMHYRFQDLIPNSKYNVTLYARHKNTTIIFSTSQHLVVSTEEGIPSEPWQVNVEQKDESNVLVSWKKPFHPHGKIQRYEIYFYPPFPPISLRVDDDVTSYLVSAQFQPNVTYSFYVVAYNGLHKSKPSVTKEIVFDGESIFGRIEDVVVAGVTNSSVSLMWKYFEEVDGFTIKIDAGYPYPQLPDLNSTTTNITVNNLAPGVIYTLKISPFNTSSIDLSSTIFIGTSGISLPEVHPLSVDYMSEQEGCAELIWEKPKDRRGVKWIYGVYYGLTKEETFETSKINTSSLATIVTNLIPCKEYIFTVGIVGPLGLGPISTKTLVVTIPKTEKTDGNPCSGQ